MSFNRKTEKQRLHKINSDIKSNQVRLVGIGEPKIMSTLDAIKMANNDGKDLILINDGEIPIVRIEEYSKFLYNLEKKQKEQKKNSVQSEIQLSWNIEEHDLLTKSKKALEFLERGDKVKCLIQLRGRQNSMPERAELVLLKFASLLEKFGVPESFPLQVANKWIMTVKPIKDKKK